MSPDTPPNQIRSKLLSAPIKKYDLFNEPDEEEDEQCVEQDEYEFDNDEDGEEQALTQYARSLSITQPVKKYKFT